MPAGRPLNFESKEALQKAIDEYFNSEDAFISIGEDTVFAPTVSGLAYHLDIATETLRRYEGRDEFGATVKKAKQRIEIALEQRLMGNNVTGTIFNLKNNFGWKDKSEQEITGKDGGPIETRQRKTVFVPVGKKSEADIESDELDE